MTSHGSRSSANNENSLTGNPSDNTDDDDSTEHIYRNNGTIPTYLNLKNNNRTTLDNNLLPTASPCATINVMTILIDRGCRGPDLIVELQNLINWYELISPQFSDVTASKNGLGMYSTMQLSTVFHKNTRSIQQYLFVQSGQYSRNMLRNLQTGLRSTED